MNKPTQQTISDTVLELQLKEVNEKAKKSLSELKAINESIDKEYGEFIDDNFDPQVNIKDAKEVDEADTKDLEAIEDDFIDKAGNIFKDEIGE